MEKKREGGEGGGKTDSQALPDAWTFFARPIRVPSPSRSFCFRIRIRRPRIGKGKRTIASSGTTRINRSNRQSNEEVLRETAGFEFRIYDDGREMRLRKKLDRTAWSDSARFYIVNNNKRVDGLVRLTVTLSKRINNWPLRAINGDLRAARVRECFRPSIADHLDDYARRGI